MPEQAKALFAQGKRYFDVADYPHAIEAWKQAYVVQAAPILLFNIAQAYRLSGDCASAARFYANYEREQPTPPNQAELSEAKAICAAKLAAAPEHKPDAKPDPAPEHTPDATTVGPTTTAELGHADLDRGPAPNTPPPAPPVDHGRPMRIGGLATAGAGFAFLVTGVVFAMKASDDASQVTAYRGPWTPTEAQLETSGQTASTIAVVATSIGVAGLVAGAGLYVLGRRHMAEQNLGVAIAPGHTELTWSAHF